MQALFMDLIISAFVLESKQWQPRIQELLKYCKSSSKKLPIQQSTHH